MKVPQQKSEPSRTKLIHKLTNHLLEHQNTVIETSHNFVDGHYIRTMYVKAGTCLVGYKHLKAHLNVLVKGSCTIYSNIRTLNLKGFSVFASPIGEQKSFLFYEDSEFFTVHKTHEKDIKTIEKEFVLYSLGA